jgi:ribonuclease E
MTKKMLIDASHAEETRVVVLDGNRLEDFDVETATRKQIKGNIYLAKVIRVEPSLQAAFVEYGGNRHGFLAFGEIHPDYYQIPVADRQRLLALQAEDAEEAEEAEQAEDAEALQNGAVDAVAPEPELVEVSLLPPPDTDIEAQLRSAQPLEMTSISIVAAPPPDADEVETAPAPAEPDAPVGEQSDTATPEVEAASGDAANEAEANYAGAHESSANEVSADGVVVDAAPAGTAELSDADAGADLNAASQSSDTDSSGAQSVETQSSDAQSGEAQTETSDAEAEYAPAEPPPESLGGDGDDAAEARERRQRQRFLRNYKIQEVIHRRQIMLIQVVKEERGNKGAALTTYLSLAGRFSVLMPNSPTGGGVSRKITSLADRRRLKEAMAELDVPQGMGLIVRTAGANRPKPEIKRDCEYLLRLWDDIRDRTMESTAPALIYEEASLIKRTIRDVYTRDVDDILVDGEEGFRAARDFMRMLMPSHAKKVQLWTEGAPLFAKYQVEAQLDAMLNPIVQLRSGGYIVINQTEALVAIDVNSGRSTRERSIEDTALRTNMEAAEEVARQLRMRDLAGLIVIDFIDMESRKNNASVERRMKDSLKNDRARIQVGAISHFGLMEMSRQRLRPSVAEASLVPCSHCGGMGHVRSPESAALHILRAIEDEGAKFRAAEILVTLPPDVALYLFNHKRDRLASIEARYAMRIVFSGDASLTAANFRIEKTQSQTAPLPAPQARVSADRPVPPPADAEESDDEADEAEDTAAPVAGETAASVPGETAEEGERRRRRRRRRGKRRSETANAPAPEVSEPGAAEPVMELEAPTEMDLVLAAELGEPAEPGDQQLSPEAEVKPARRRRVRGGRRRASSEPGDEAINEAPAQEVVYADIADIFEAAERAEEAQRVRAHIVIEAEPGPEPLPKHVPEVGPEPVLERGPASALEAAPEQAYAAPEPAFEPVAAGTGELAPEAVAAEAAPASAPEPLVKPTIIGASEEPVEKKRGWWRR